MLNDKQSVLLILLRKRPTKCDLYSLHNPVKGSFISKHVLKQNGEIMSAFSSRQLLAFVCIKGENMYM